MFTMPFIPYALNITSNPESWISFLTLIFTIIIGFVTVLSVIYGFITTKKFIELQTEHRNLKTKIEADFVKMDDLKAKYDTLLLEAKQSLSIALSRPDLEMNREFIDAAIDNMEQKSPMSRKHQEKLISAMYAISQSGEISDVKRLTNIYSLAKDNKKRKLKDEAIITLKRFGN